MSFVDEVVYHVEAGYQALYIPTMEEVRCEEELRTAARHGALRGDDFELVRWDCVEGFHGHDGNPLLHPIAALQAIPSDAFEGNCFAVFRDLPEMFRKDQEVRRAFRNLCQANALVNTLHRRPLFILAPGGEVHPEIAPHVAVLEFGLPGDAELAAVFDFIVTSMREMDPDAHVECPDDLRRRVTQALKGMTSTEAENALSLALYRHGGFVPEMLETLEIHKAAVIRKSEVLTYLPKDRIASEAEIGGYEDLLDFVRQRAAAYTPAARELAIDLPKGLVLLGVPGTGKSMVAKAIARLLQLPLALFDVASVFASLVGESEQRMRGALRTVEALDGCVLVLDEIDKALGGAHASSGDSGVARRVFGQLLTWLAEKSDRTFVVATLNRTEGLPPELFRKGRFDEVFYADVPDRDERREILEIHLRKRGVEPTIYDEPSWERLLAATKDYVGSELEEVVRAARFASFHDRGAGEPGIEELVGAAESTVPIVILDAENVAAIRDFCSRRARPVARQPAKRSGRAGRAIGPPAGGAGRRGSRRLPPANPGATQ